MGYFIYALLISYWNFPVVNPPDIDDSRTASGQGLGEEIDDLVGIVYGHLRG